MRPRILYLLLFIAVCGTASASTTTSYTGSLDPNNADDVFITSFTTTSIGIITIQSYGYGGTSDTPTGANAAGTIISSGGFDTYVSLFLGSGPTATFLASNDDGFCGPAHPDPVCEDSRLQYSAGPGTYTIALTLPGNYSIAENYGYGTLGDGFIDLQADYYDAASNAIRTSNYALDVTHGSDVVHTLNPVPEPNPFTLVFTGLLAPALILLQKRRISTHNAAAL